MLVRLDDAPYILSGVAEFAASNAGTEVELADGDGVVLDGVGKVVVAFGHGSDEDSDALVGVQTLDVIPDADHL